MVEDAKMPLYMKGVSPQLMAEVEKRVEEFERDHEQDVIHGGAGFVDRIRSVDYVIVVVINAILGIYWLWAILT